MTRHAPDEPARQPLQEEVRATGHRISKTAGEAASETSAEAEARAEQEKDRTAGRLDDVAQATHRAAEELQGREDWLADAVGAAASELEGLARGVRNRNVGDLIGDLETFGRRYPTALFGVAAAIGFGAVRFAKSSEQRRLHGSRRVQEPEHPAYEAAARRID